MRQDKTVKEEAFSDRLVRLVQVVFAVVIGGSLIHFNEILFPPKYTVAFLALIGVYVTAITSWTGYHYRIVQFQYTHTKFGIGRLFADIFIVIMYAFLLFVGTKQGQSIETYLWGFSVVFIFYFVSGWLRCKEHDDSTASNRRLIRNFLLAYTFSVPLSFRILTWHGGISALYLSPIFVWFPLVVMLIFRWRHEWKELPWRI